jgi:hypothetical protein
MAPSQVKPSQDCVAIVYIIDLFDDIAFITSPPPPVTPHRNSRRPQGVTPRRFCGAPDAVTHADLPIPQGAFREPAQRIVRTPLEECRMRCRPTIFDGAVR